MFFVVWATIDLIFLTDRGPGATKAGDCDAGVFSGSYY